MRKYRKIIKRSPAESVIFSFVFILFLLYAAAILYPLLFGIQSSLQKDSRTFINDMAGFPTAMRFQNYVEAFVELEVSQNNFLQMLVNSLWFSVGGSMIGVLCSTMAAYTVCKYRFRGKEFFYNLSLFIMIIPIVGSLPAQYKLYSDLGITNSPLLLITYTGGFGYNFIIIYAFFKSVSWTYAEAAFIDGAGHYSVFFRIMLPQALPAMLAIEILAFIGLYNDYQTPILYLDRLPTLASGLYYYERIIQHQANHPVYFAGVIISIIPVLLLFGVFQNTLMENITTGGLKG